MFCTRMLRPAVKAAHISVCQSAHVISWLRFIYIRLCSFRCSNYVTAEVYRISCIHCIHKHTLTLTFWIMPQKFAVSHFTAMHQFGKEAHKKPYSQNCTIRFDNSINKTRFLFADFPFFAHMREQRAAAYRTFRRSSRRIVICLFCHPFFFFIFSLHLWSFYLNINQLDALNFIMSLFHASTCFEHKCSSSGGQNCTIQSLVSSHL